MAIVMPGGRREDGLDGEEGVLLGSASLGGHVHGPEPYVSVMIGVVVAVLTPDENQRKVAMNDSRTAKR